MPEPDSGPIKPSDETDSLVPVFLDVLEEEYPILAPSVRNTFSSDPVWFEYVGNTLLGWAKSVLGKGWAKTLADGYCELTHEASYSQQMYESARAYRFRSYDEVRKATYDNETFMQPYHWGLYVANFVWEHHLKLCRYYLDRFVPLLKDAGSLVDLGFGSGLWTMLALWQGATCSVEAVDISETTLSLARKMAEGNGYGQSISWHCADALLYRRDEPAEAGISSFLIEHLEEPDRLLESLGANLKPHAYAFVTCALTAAEIDHIYEVRRESEPILMAERAGFRVLEYLCTSPPYYPDTSYYIPRSMAMILQKRIGDLW